MIILLYIACLIILVYVLFIGYVSVSFQKTQTGNNRGANKVSVIIPCRNEMENIGYCLNAISKQAMPKLQFEVILVDDFSEDSTVNVAEHFKGILPLTILRNNIPGKKNALKFGIEAASNEMIITTDGDCTMGENWLTGMLSEFENNQLNMLCGPIKFKDSDDVFEQLQQTESAAIVGISAVMMNSKKPSTCNGANLMFRKSVFTKIGGYANHSVLASGDDDLLMHEFYEENPSGVRYSLNEQTMVSTKACADLKQFLHQRIRWLAKRKYYIYHWNAYLQTLVFGQLLAFYFLLFYSICTLNVLAIMAILSKYFFDMLFGSRLRSVFDFRYFQILLMPFFESYIFLVLFFSGLKRNHWKGRRL